MLEQFIANASKCGELDIYSVWAQDIWPVMTLFSMITKRCSLRGSLKQKPFVIFFSDISKQVHKVIISKGVIWSSYNIHCVSLHNTYHHHPSSFHYDATITLEASTSSPSFSLSNPQDLHSSREGRGGLNPANFK